MKPKHVIRALKRYVKENLPKHTYWAIEKTYQPFFDEESKEWKKGLLVQVPVNHGRRVKKVFKKHGIQAAMSYLAYYKNEKINNDEPVVDEPKSVSTKEGTDNTQSD